MTPPAGLLILALLALVVVLVLIIIWLRRRRPTPPSPPPPPCPPPKVPDDFDEPTLSATLGVRLAGTPADGSLRFDPSVPPPRKVIWVEAGDEAVVHLDSTKVRMLDRTLLVSVDLETDQTGRTPLVVVLALGNPGDPAGLVATTDDLPRGNGLLAARWGRALQASVWATLLSMAREHALERDQAPRGISIAAGRLSFHAGAPLHAGSIAGGGA